MLITYDDERMLDVWRQGALLEPALAEASIERFDSLDIKQRLRMTMRAWYIDYLANAPVDMVPVSDLTEYARTAAGPAEGSMTLRLVCETARITEITLDGYGDVSLMNPDSKDNAEILKAMGNKFVRNGDTPKAFYRPRTDTAVIFFPGDEEPVITAVRGVLIPEDDVFVFDERMLAEIPALAQSTLSNLYQS